MYYTLIKNIIQMKKIVLVVLGFFSNISFGQTFSFELYFEDALGQKDTLVFGYDLNATDSIDVSFQETNIISQPWSNQFEARISVLEYPNDFGWDEYNSLTEVGQLKKQIKKEDCLGQSLYISLIQMNNPVYPVSITWDNSLFADQCKINSVITDWHPSGWFDAFVGGVTPHEPIELRTQNSATFEYTAIHNINSNLDTLDVLYFALGNNNQVFVKSLVLDKIGLSVYPNPSSNGIFHIEFNNGQQLKSVVLNDIKGQSFEIPFASNNIDISQLTNGIYFLSVQFENGAIETIKLSKQ